MAQVGFHDVPMSMGTTIVAVCYDEGVMIAADSRTSTGMYIGSRATEKIDQLCENIFIARSGNAADTQFVRDYMKSSLEWHALQINDEVPVKTAAKMTERIIYENKKLLKAGIIIAGYDKMDGGSVYTVTLGGSLVKASFALGGSGSTYINGFFDKYWTNNMNEQRCKEFLTRAVAHAMGRDGASGGCIRIVAISKAGVKKAFIPGDQVPLTFGNIKPQVVAPKFFTP